MYENITTHTYRIHGLVWLTSGKNCPHFTQAHSITCVCMLTVQLGEYVSTQTLIVSAEILHSHRKWDVCKHSERGNELHSSSGSVVSR